MPGAEDVGRSGGHPIGRGLWGHGFLRRDNPGLAFLSQAIAFAFDGQDVAVVQKPVQDGCRHHLASEHFTPGPDGLVAGDHQASLFVALAHEVGVLPTNVQ